MIIFEWIAGTLNITFYTIRRIYCNKKLAWVVFKETISANTILHSK
jgi:hypothetical protein